MLKEEQGETVRKRALILTGTGRARQATELSLASLDADKTFCTLDTVEEKLAQRNWDIFVTDFTDPLYANIVAASISQVREKLGEGTLLRDNEITIDLATYQVQVNGEPLNLTYLEYELLAFLVTHPNKTFSRDALLRQVWGFDYLGGSRTVDVHVRRLRSKLGPEMSRKLETIRGFGYLWNAE